MTGSACSTASTSGRHPNLLQQQGCRENGVSDKLRRMAIKNSYESRSLCGSGAGDIHPVPVLVEKASRAPTDKLLPTVTKQLSSHRYSLSSRSKRPAQKQLSAPPRSMSAAVRIKVTPSTVHDVGASAGEDPKVDEAKTETQMALLQAPPDAGPLSAIPAHLRRSTSHSSVAVNGTNSLSQPSSDSSSYIYHIPNRLIQRGRSRSLSRVHAHMHTHNISTLSLKRSSSHSTVALNRTGHHHQHPGQHKHPCSSSTVPPSHASGTTAPPTKLPATPLSISMAVVHHPEPPHHHHNHHNPRHLHRHHHRHGNGWKGSLSQDHFDAPPTTIDGGHNKAHKRLTSDVGLVESQFPRMFKHIEHTTSDVGHRRRHPSLSPSPCCSQSSVHHSGASSYRHKYHTIHAESLAEFDVISSHPTNSFGTSPRFRSASSVGPPAVLPHLVSGHPHQSHMKSSAQQDGLRRKRVTLHTPRGKKVASLV